MRKQLQIFTLALALATSASVSADPTPDKLVEEVGNLDRLLFGSFNRCDQPGQLDAHAAMFAIDLEFYHDLGGVTWTRDAMLEGVRNNVCGKFARELVPGTMKVSPIKDFGAISTGTHRFCHFASGLCEGEADFVILWRLKDRKWEVTRVMSYAHRSLPERPAPLDPATVRK